MVLYINTLFHFNRLHTTAKAVSEAEYSASGAAKPGPQVSQVHCIIIIIIIIIITIMMMIIQLNLHVQPPLVSQRLR